MSTAQIEIPKGVLQKRFAQFVIQQDERLFDIFSSDSNLSVSLTTPKIMIIVLALLVHSISPLIVLLAIYIVQTNWAGRISICWGIALLPIAWISRPHFDKKPEELLDRSAHPALFALVDRITSEVHAKPIDDICFVTDTNAAMGRYGILQRRILYIGYPLWSQLNEQERIALLSHEIAHDRNGDSLLSILRASALNILSSWHDIIAPSRNPNRYDSVMSLPFRLVLSFVAQGILLVFYAFQQLGLYESRRAEYLADRTATRLGGTQATLSLLENLQRDERRSISLLHYTHPPFSMRIRLIRTQPAFPASIEVSSEVMREIDDALMPIAKLIGRRNQENR